MFGRILAEKTKNLILLGAGKGIRVAKLDLAVGHLERVLRATRAKSPLAVLNGLGFRKVLDSDRLDVRRYVRAVVGRNCNNEASVTAAAGYTCEIAFQINIAVDGPAFDITFETDHAHQCVSRRYPQLTVDIPNVNGLINAGKIDVARHSFHSDLAVRHDL